MYGHFTAMRAKLHHHPLDDYFVGDQTMSRHLVLHRPSIQLLTCALLVGLTACAERATPEGSDPASQPASAPVESATPAPAAPGEATTSDTSATIPADVVVSTNEPFWTARAEGEHLLLTGLDNPERKLPIISSQADGQNRIIVANDAQGKVEVRVQAGRCEDSMSGAEFPFSGELRLPGSDSAITGCARPASMPPPTPPESDASTTQPAPVDAAKATIPDVFQGYWAPDQAGCDNPDSTIEGVRIAARELRFHESVGIPSAVRQASADTLELTVDYKGEGQTWTLNQTLRREAADRITIISPDGFRMTRVRCAAKP